MRPVPTRTAGTAVRLRRTGREVVRQTGIVRVKNDSGADRGRGEILGVADHEGVRARHGKYDKAS